jgi:hypothetical protein
MLREMMRFFCIVGLRAGGAEEHMVDVGRCDRGELVGQQRRSRRRAAEEGVVVRQFLHLRIGGVRQFVAAVTDIDAPEARHGVEDFVAFGVVDERPIGARDDTRARGSEVLVIREGMQVVRGIHLLKLRQRKILIAHGFGPVS